MLATAEPELEAGEKKSTHKAEVVPVVLEKHPDADSLSVVRIWGFTCVARTADWEGIDRAAYLQPDTVVDVTRPEFAFLAQDANADGKTRIKARRLRGVVSQGLLVPAMGAEIGDDLWDQLGLSRYEPPEPGSPSSKADRFVVCGESDEEPDLCTGPAKYDVEAFERYHDRLVEGEPCLIQEKVDGSNTRVVFWKGRLHVKSRNRWLKRTPDYSHVTEASLLEKGCPPEKVQQVLDRVHGQQKGVNSFWQVLEKYPTLLNYLEQNPGTVVYGEIYGSTNRIKYSFADGNRFAAFDVFRGDNFLDAPDMVAELTAAKVPMAPCQMVNGSTNIPYSFDTVVRLREGPTMAVDAKKGVIREGCVVRPWRERSDRKLGRVVLKAVSPAFHALNTKD